MNNSHTISVILCTWNSEKTIAETILSLYNQTYKDFELVVIDKSSTDQTLNIIRSYFPYAKIVCQSGSGIYSAFNEGIKYSKGELLFILNSDDVISSNAFFDIVGNYKKEKFDAAFLPTYSDGGFRNKINYKKLFLGCDFCFFGHSASFIVRRQVHQDIGFYNETIKYSADYEFFLRLIKNSYKIHAINSLSFGIFRPGGFSGTGNYLEKRIEEFKFRHHDFKNTPANFIYCYFIFPLQCVWYLLKRVKP